MLNKKIVRTLSDMDSFIKDIDGNVKTLYHGTPNGGFEEFSDKYLGIRTGHDKADVGFHFTDDPDYANTYADTITIKCALAYEKAFNESLNKPLPHSTIIPVYLSMNKPLILDTAKEINRYSIERAKEQKCDGIIAYHGNGTEYVVFNSNQIYFKYITIIK